MRRGLAILGILLAGPALAAPPVVLGQYAGWGAFRADGPRHCYAIARPQGAKRDDPAYATVGAWPGRGLARQLHLHLSHEAKKATLRIEEARFPLRVEGREAWTADPRDDARIARALRGAEGMRVEGTGIHRGRFSDTYALAGAASAIDAADLGCAGD